MASVIIRPVITEKSMALVGTKKYTFRVTSQANREDVKKSIEKAFSVHVTSVEMSTEKGKRKRVGKYRAETRIQPTKKAVVALKDGEKIDIFELGS